MRSRLLLLILGLVSAPALAQEPVDLAEALEAVEQANPTLAGARASLAAARVATRRAWAAYLPSVVAYGTYTRNSAVAELAFPDFAQGFQMVETPEGPTLVPRSVQSIEVQKENQLGFQLQAQQAILAPSAIPAIGAARAGVRAAEWGTEEVRRELLFVTAELFHATVAMAEAVRVTESHVELFREHLRVAEVAYQAGSSPEIAVLRARTDLRSAERDLVAARRDHRTLVGQLAQLMGREEADIRVVPPAELQQLLDGATPVQVADADADAALMHRPSYRSRLEQLRAAKKQHSAALAAFLPTVGAGFTYNLSNTSGFTGQNDWWAATAQVSLPILDRGLRLADVDEARARVREAEAAVEENELQVRQDIREAEAALEAAITSLEAARDQAELARRSWQALETSFAAGAASAIEVADAASNLRSADLAVISEAVAYVSARIRLLRAAGVDDPLASTLP